MARNTTSNARSGSTTWEWRRVKISEPAPQASTSPKAPSRFGGLKRRKREDRLNVTIAYKGGSEAWWVIEARGRAVAFPGHRALHDVMAEINRDNWDF